MKKRFGLVFLGFAMIAYFFIIDGNFIKYASADSENYSEIVMDVNTNRVLFEKNSKDKRFMASLTKIMTALIVIENCNLDTIVSVGKETTNVEGSSIYLVEGEKLSIKELLYGLMLRSGNDAAETLAVACSRNIADFVKLMNEKALELGAQNTNFVNPHGLHDENHYTSAYDLALICSYAMKNRVFREIVSTKKITISNSKQDYKRVLINKNKLLFNNENAIGIKTGFTKKAGRCLASAFNKNGHEVVCVVLNVPPMFERCSHLSNEAFDNYTQYKILERDDVFDFISFGGSDKKYPVCIKKDVLIPLTKSEKENLKYEVEYYKNISTPIKKDTEIGKINFFVENNLIFTEKIYTILDIK